MTTRTTGRHRAAARPTTPWSTLTDAIASSSGTVGRRSAVIAASSGLVVTMGLPAAGATPGTDAPVVPPSPAAHGGTDAPAPVVSVPADATVSLARSALTTVTAPPVVAEPARSSGATPDTGRAGTAASRSQRTSVQASLAEAGGSILAIAARYVGTPYVYGGTTPAGFDCSGYVAYVYRQLGVALPRTAGAQQSAGVRVSRSQAQPGDIVSFVDGSGVYHNGIYAGDGQLYDAPRTGKSVSKRAIWTSSVTFTRVIG